MEFKFVKRQDNNDLRVKIGDHNIPKQKLNGLGILDPFYHMQMRVMEMSYIGPDELRNFLGIICDCKMPIKFERKFYCIATRLAML